MRPNARSQLFKSIEAGQEIPLEEFTQYILKDYEAYGTRDVTNQRKATFALMVSPPYVPFLFVRSSLAPAQGRPSPPSTEA